VLRAATLLDCHRGCEAGHALRFIAGVLSGKSHNIVKDPDPKGCETKDTEIMQTTATEGNGKEFSQDLPRATGQAIDEVVLSEGKCAEVMRTMANEGNPEAGLKDPLATVKVNEVAEVTLGRAISEDKLTGCKAVAHAIGVEGKTKGKGKTITITKGKGYLDAGEAEEMNDKREVEAKSAKHNEPQIGDIVEKEVDGKVVEYQVVEIGRYIGDVQVRCIVGVIGSSRYTWDDPGKLKLVERYRGKGAGKG
jgi:hypothetical protein